MFDPKSPEDLQVMLLHMAAAGARAPGGRSRVARWFRAALILVEGDEDPALPPTAAPTPAERHAMRELAEALDVAREHAVWLARRAEGVTDVPPPSPPSS